MSPRASLVQRSLTSPVKPGILALGRKILLGSTPGKGEKLDTWLSRTIAVSLAVVRSLSPRAAGALPPHHPPRACWARLPPQRPTRPAPLSSDAGPAEYVPAEEVDEEADQLERHVGNTHLPLIRTRQHAVYHVPDAVYACNSCYANCIMYHVLDTAYAGT